ncbi:MAG: peptidoglycan DD-metalloendopeptidase family protein [Saprospiraceae bacterium]|nr:peptidoglycan DD-metalloendopeptidase family protein [Saprospiraceae bacterium]
MVWFKFNKYYTLLIFTVLVFVVVSINLFAQNSQKLRREDKQLKLKIEKTNEAISKSKTEQASIKKESSIIADSIREHDEYLQNLRTSIQHTDNDITRQTTVINAMQADINKLKSEYTVLARKVYRDKLNHSDLLFLLTSESINQAFLRWQYLKRYDDFRKRQIHFIVNTIQSLQLKMNTLNQFKLAQVYAADSVQTEKKELNQDLVENQNELKKLASEEQKLRKALAHYELKQQQLTQKIADVLRINAAKTESRRKRNDNSTKVEKSNNINRFTPKEIPKDSDEDIALAKEFIKNKGKLPWPMKQGHITRVFGTQPHPTLKGVQVPSKGIDIESAADANVRAIFDGTVMGIFSIPGYDNTVIIKHGIYFTVYTNLSRIQVKTNDSITTAQVIGQAGKAIENDNYLLHFSLWQTGNIPHNPAIWLKK